MGKIKRILLGIVVLSLCLTLFAGQSPDTGALIPDESPAVTSRTRTDEVPPEAPNQGDDDKAGDPDATAAVTQTRAVSSSPDGTEVAPVATVVSIKLGSCTLFKDRNNRLTLKNDHDIVSESETVETDEGEIVTINCRDGQVSFFFGGEEVTSFNYNGQAVEIRDGQVYYGGKLMEYRDTSFHSYDISKNLSISLNAAGRYKLAQGGTDVSQGKVYTDQGQRLTISLSADGKTIDVTSESGDPIDEFTVGGVEIKKVGSLLYIGGRALAKEHSADVVTSTASKETSQTTQETEQSAVGTEASRATGQTTARATTTTKAAVTTRAAATTTTKAAQTTTSKTSPLLPSITPDLLAPISSPSDGRSVKIVEYKDYTAQMLTLINSARASNGVGALKADPTGRMYEAAKIRAEEYAYYPKLSHIRPTARGGKKYETVFANVGMQVYLYMTKYSSQLKYSMHEYSYASGENLASGFNVSSGGYTDADPQWAFSKWMASSSHKANILKSNVEYLGVCRVTTTEMFSGVSVTKHYWVMLIYKETVK